MKSALSDYLILHSSNADMSKATSGVMIFYIDNQYYSNTRGPVCDVKLIVCNASLEVANNDCCIVESDLGLQNAYNSNNDVFNPMYSFKDNVITQVHVPSYRIGARPQKIAIRLRSLDGTPFNLTQNNFSASFIFEFKYENVKDEIDDYVDSSYKTVL